MDEIESTEAADETAAATGDKKARRVHFRRTRALFRPLGRVLNKIPHPPLRSKRGIFVLVVLVGGFGMVAGVGTMTAIHFSETAGFCGMCHTMDPELKAYEMSAHKEVACAECHVEPGVGGFVKAKANGTKQLYGILTGKYPTPIPPPDHSHLPKVQDSCMKCHEIDKLTKNGGPVRLILRPRYRLDKDNTRDMVAVLLRPAGIGQTPGLPGSPEAAAEGAVRGVHWHVEQEVTYTSDDEHATKIPLVDIKFADGTTKQYISGTEVGVSTDVKPDIDRLKKSQTTRTMDCISCHNRVGHPVPSAEKSVDEAMAAGKISPLLPFIKRDAVALLKANYATTEAADKAIAGLRKTYAAKYPLVMQKNEVQVDGAIKELKHLYELIATPAMKVQAKTYPDNLGHQGSLGCFRCHDDAHYRVLKGKITTEKIPSACSTCHTFPQIGKNGSTAPASVGPDGGAQVGPKPVSFPLINPADLPLGARPADHTDKLYVFSHKLSVSKLTPAGTTCAGCHTKNNCENCHNSGAVKVKHVEMLYKHTYAIRAAGGAQACSYCHQPVFCEKCHKDGAPEPGAAPKAIKVRQPS
jgi:nitrate/TMAO reductase-like tetraheme cytochrome c subunit